MLYYHSPTINKWGAALLAIFINVGQFKDLLSLPTYIPDLSLVSAILILLFSMVIVLQRKSISVSKSILLIIPLYSMSFYLFSLFHCDYPLASQGIIIQNIMLIILYVGIVFIIDSRESLDWFLATSTIIGILFTCIMLRNYFLGITVGGFIYAGTTTYLAAARIVLLSYLVLVFYYWYYSNSAIKFVYLFAGCACFLAIILAGGRSTFLTLLICTIVFIIFVPNKNKITYWVLIGTIAILLINISSLGMLDLIDERMNALFTNTDTFGSRQSLLKTSIEMVIQKPIFGWGPGAFQYIYYGFDTSSPNSTHNVITELLCDIGFIGSIIFFVYLLFTLWCFSKIVKMCKTAKDYKLLAIISTGYIYGLSFLPISTYTNKIMHFLIIAPVLIYISQKKFIIFNNTN